MTIYEQASELSNALSSLLKKVKESMVEAEGIPAKSREEYTQFQSLLASSVFLQRDLDDFLEKAMTIGDQDHESPIEILDFSKDWDRFE